jgi:hypothetical protein
MIEKYAREFERRYQNKLPKLRLIPVKDESFTFCIIEGYVKLLFVSTIPKEPQYGIDFSVLIGGEDSALGATKEDPPPAPQPSAEPPPP